MANTLKFGNGQWATKEGSTLAYNDENGNFKPLPFDFTRASSATRVNKDGLIETVGSNEPRIDFLNDSKGALLLEPQRTNNLLQSNQFDTTWVTNTATIEGGQVGVGNTNDAWLLSRTGTNGRIYQTSTSSGSQTLSVYAKSNTNNWLFLVIGSSETAYYDLENGVVGTTSSSNIAKIEPIGNNGWYRCSLTFTYTNPQVRIYPAFADNDVTGSGSIYIQNAQLEVGYATSYIPTQGSAVTRVADVCTNAGNNQVINSTEGVLYFQGSSIANDGTFKRISVGTSDNLFENSIQLRYNAIDNSITYQFRVGNVYQADLTITTNTTNVNKIACVWKINRFEIWVNGVKEAQDTSGSVPTLNTFDSLFFGKVSASLTEPFYGNVKDLRVYNTALTDAELQALTTL